MRLKGSITVYYSMILIFLISLFFTMTETIRLLAVNRNAQVICEESLESCFSEYNKYLYEWYGVMGVDKGYGSLDYSTDNMKSHLLRYARSNTNPQETIKYGVKSNMCSLIVGNVDVEDFGILTDNNASPLIMSCVSEKKDEYGGAIVDKIVDQFQETDKLDEYDVEKIVDDGFDAVIEQNIFSDNEGEVVSEELVKKELEYSPIGGYDQLKESIDTSILSQLIVDTSKISTKQVGHKLPSTRHLYEGNKNDYTSVNLVAKGVFVKYLLDKMSCYGNDTPSEGFDYELEYILCGENTEYQNLSSIASRLLLMREASNMAYLITDQQRVAQAEALAATIAALLMAPEATEALKYAFLAAWAYAESVLDVRLLFKGGKVPLMKDSSSWTSDLMMLSSYTNVNITAKDTAGGLTYKEYLGTMLCALSNKKLGLRTADVMEYAVSSKENFENFRMDNVIYRCSINESFNADPLFLNFVVIGNAKATGFFYKKHYQMNYLE